MASKQQKASMRYTGFIVLDNENERNTPTYFWSGGETSEDGAKEQVQEELEDYFDGVDFPEGVKVLVFNENTGDCKMLKVTPPKPLEFEDF